MESTLAVLRLRTSSTFVTCCTGSRQAFHPRPNVAVMPRSAIQDRPASMAQFHVQQPSEKLRFTQAEPGRVYRKISYGPLLDVLMLDMRSHRGPSAKDWRRPTAATARCGR